MVRLLVNAQHCTGESQVNVVISSLGSTFHTLNVRSQEAETARRPSPLTATPMTPTEMAFASVEFAAGFQIPHLQRLVI